MKRYLILILTMLSSVGTHAENTRGLTFGELISPQNLIPQNPVFMMSDGSPRGSRAFELIDEAEGVVVDVALSVHGPVGGYYLIAPEEALQPQTRYYLVAIVDENTRVQSQTFLTTNYEDLTTPDTFELLRPTLTKFRPSSIADPGCGSDTWVFDISAAPTDVFAYEVFDAEKDEPIFLMPNARFLQGSLGFLSEGIDATSFYIELIDVGGNRRRTNTVEGPASGCSSLHATSSGAPSSSLALVGFALLFLSQSRVRRTT